MIFQYTGRNILVFCICMSAVLVPSHRSAFAQTASANAGGTPNAFFRALRTIDAQQNAVAATRIYARPVDGIRAAVYTPNLYQGTVQPSPFFSPTTASGQTPASFYRAVRAIDSQQNAPYTTPTFVRPAPTARPVPSPWSTQPIAEYRTVTAPPPQDSARQIATSSEPRKVSILSTNYWLSYPQNAWRIIAAPYRFDTNDWLASSNRCWVINRRIT